MGASCSESATLPERLSKRSQTTCASNELRPRKSCASPFLGVLKNVQRQRWMIGSLHRVDWSLKISRGEMIKYWFQPNNGGAQVIHHYVRRRLWGSRMSSNLRWAHELSYQPPIVPLPRGLDRLVKGVGYPKSILYFGLSIEPTEKSWTLVDGRWRRNCFFFSLSLSPWFRWQRVCTEICTKIK